MTKNISDTFFHIENGAHTGAFGDNQYPTPSDAQTKAGNYKLGRVNLHGLSIAIEQPRHTYRTGIDSKTGKRWTNRLAAHYGHFSGTKGNDGDGVDCFVGGYPQSEQVYVVNQFVNGRFDEHKVMAFFPDEHTARRAYLDSYDKDWAGLKSMVPATISQFKWWLKNGDMKKPLAPEHLPNDGLETMNLKRIYWNTEAQPENMSIDKLLYEIRRADGNNTLMLDSVSMQDILEGVESILTFDALITPYAKLERKMNILKTVMERTTGSVKPLSVQISDPFKQNGTAQVAVVFELSDGQTVSIFFHNPDVTPGKIAPTDELISWKWLLNKKDITIVVAPEKGTDLNVHDVALRIMKLADKNSAAFQRANVNRAAKMQAIEAIKEEIVTLETELKDAQHELEVAKVEAEDRASNPKPVIDWTKAESLDSQAKMRALGIATIDEIGNENVYVEKDGKPYFFKPGNTDKYAVGEHDFSNDNAFGESSDTGKETKKNDDSATVININKSPISNTLKKKAIAYLQENPESHEIKGLSARSLNAVMESIRTALFSEIKTLSPLFKEVGADNLNLTTKSGYLQIAVFKQKGAETGYKMSFYGGDDNGTTSLFDSTSTIDDLRAWDFALPFDLDVKVFVNNVIKPAVDELLNKQQPDVVEPEPTIDPNETSLATLKSIINGNDDTLDLTELANKLYAAGQALVDAGVGDQYDDLIGAACDKYAALEAAKGDTFDGISSASNGKKPPCPKCGSVSYPVPNPGTVMGKMNDQVFPVNLSATNSASNITADSANGVSVDMHVKTPFAQMNEQVFRINLGDKKDYTIDPSPGVPEQPMNDQIVTLPLGLARTVESSSVTEKPAVYDPENPGLPAGVNSIVDINNPANKSKPEVCNMCGDIIAPPSRSPGKSGNLPVPNPGNIKGKVADQVFKVRI